MNEKGERIKEAGPSDAVQILGFDQVPQSGDILAEVTNESDLKKIANDRQRIKREIDLQMVQKKSGIMDVCFRDIRAKAGTDKKREGGDAQVFLGHNSSAMTDKYIRNREGDRVSPNVPIIKK